LLFEPLGSGRVGREDRLTGDIDIYARQGFGHRLRPGRRAALLVVDFVNGFTDPDLLGGGNIGDAARRTVPVLARCRDAGVAVIFTRIVYADDGSDAGLWCEKVPALRGLTETAPESQVVQDLLPRKGEAIIRKTQASAFFGTGLAPLLTGRGIDTLLVAGCTTSGCVRASVVDAMSHNFRTVLLRDCIGDRAEAPHVANLFDMEQKYADAIDSGGLGDLLAAMARG
jgi:maleamate amidohydrolase